MIYGSHGPPNPPEIPSPPQTCVADLPKSLRVIAALVLTGHNRREIAYLLNLPDTALRQRISALKRHLVAKGLAAPEELSGLHLDLAYGRIRDVLLPALLRHGGSFASHDPDGHLFVVRRSQNGPAAAMTSCRNPTKDLAMPLKPKNVSVVFYVSDIARTETFYNQTLGLQLERQDGADPFWLQASIENGPDLIFFQMDRRTRQYACQSSSISMKAGSMTWSPNSPSRGSIS